MRHLSVVEGGRVELDSDYWLYVPAMLPPRLQSRVAVQSDGCWNWSHTMESNGYGQISINGRLLMSHRVVYESLVGPIPLGLVLDHLCRNRACCNPSHLEPVTQRVNTLRGVSPAAIHAAKTHCCNGHEFTHDNTHMQRKRGLAVPYRSCRVCGRDKARRRRAA